MSKAGEILVWFLLGAIAVNIVTHAPNFTQAADASFGFANGMFSDLTSKKGAA